jgi:hypothetical protein
MIPNNVQGDVAQEVNDRMAKATRELQEKYARGEGGQDVSVDGPSGTAYKEKHMKELADKKKARQEKQNSYDEGQSTEANAGEADNSDDEHDDEDVELRQIRAQRLKQIKIQQTQKLENLAKGHGQYREVLQDEFLAEVTSSLRVVCHFYHRDFPRCEVMNHHLARLASKHIEAKFIKVNAEKAPFFIDKVRMLFIYGCL